MGTKREFVPQYGPQGEGEVKELSDRIKIRLGEEIHEFPKDEDSLPFGKLFTGKGLYLALNADETRLLYVRPFRGTFVGKFAGLSHAEDELPEPRLVEAQKKERKNPKTGKTSRWIDPERLKFTALVEVTDGQYEGAVYPVSLDYLFARDTDGTTKVKASRKAWLDRLINAWECFGYSWDNESVPFEPNLLPVFDAMFTERDTRFTLNVENGWIDTMAGLAEGVVVAKAPKAKATERLAAQIAAPAEEEEDGGF